MLLHLLSLPTASSSASLIAAFLCRCERLFSTCLGCPLPAPAQCTGCIFIAALFFTAQPERHCKPLSLPTSTLLHNHHAARCTGCCLVSALPFPSLHFPPPSFPALPTSSCSLSLREPVVLLFVPASPVSSARMHSSHSPLIQWRSSRTG